MVVVLVMGFFAAARGALTGGWHLLSLRITDNQSHSVLFVLAVCAAVMFVIEMIIRLKKEGEIIALAPKLKEKRIGAFAAEAVINYVCDVVILSGALFFFSNANEYGFAAGNKYYQPFFSLMTIYWNWYLALGLPYILLTRALQYDTEADRREPAYLLLKVLARIFSRFRIAGLLKRYDLFDVTGDPGIESFGENDTKILLGIFVKMFFVPVMTVFFTDQFTHLVGNYTYLIGLLQGGRDANFSITDFYNVSFTLIFSIDVGLAWCGYTVSTRWLKNTCVSVEPTVLGWLVAILCYPPFQRFIGIYVTVPPEKGFLSIPHPWLVVLFAVMSILSYLVYVSATVVFGMRFSNLTHRGIVRTGPFAFIRHPAYAAKNFSWWCVMMPYVIYEAASRDSVMVLIQLLGLAAMTGIYYVRAITEERHLSIDPEYQDYCRQVPYRFIPGIC